MDTLSNVYKQKRQHVKNMTWRDIEIGCKFIFDECKKDNIKSVYGVPRGGVIPAVILSHLLNVQLLLKPDNIDSETLIIDDIEDSGKTLEQYKKQYNNSKVFAIVTKKRIGSVCNYKPLFIIDNKDVWIEFPWEMSDGFGK